MKQGLREKSYFPLFAPRFSYVTLKTFFVKRKLLVYELLRTKTLMDPALPRAILAF